MAQKALQVGLGLRMVWLQPERVFEVCARRICPARACFKRPEIVPSVRIIFRKMQRSPLLLGRFLQVSSSREPLR